MQHVFFANLEIFTTVVVTGVAALLAAVSLYSYRRIGHPRALYIGLAFLAFTAKGLYLVVRSYEARGSEAWVLHVALMDLVVLLLMYLAIKKR